MKSVLISIKPKYCELIANGKKTIELRKTRTKLDTPFKCYIYETQAKCDVPQFVDEDGHVDYRGRGQVIGEFVCDGITELIPISTPSIGVYRYLFASDEFKKAACLDAEKLLQYGKGKALYGWSILSTKIYDEPKGIGEFKHWTNSGMWWCKEKLSRPPQSWCYVEELK